MERPAKILITGGTGFLGAYIIRELVVKGFIVRAIRRANKQMPFYISADIFEKVEWVEGDILDVVALEQAMKDMDAVIHAAAKVSYHSADRAEMLNTNIQGTANVVNLALEASIQKVVYVSSVAALGRTENGDTVTEEKKWEENRRTTSYALSKYHAEMEVWRGMGEGLNVTVVNPSIVVGYGDWNSSSCAIFKNIYNEFPWYTKGVTGFVDVEDVAKAVVELLVADANGERFILNGENLTFQQVFTEIANGLHKKPPHREATKLLGEIAWRFEKLKAFITGNKPLLTRESARVSHTQTYFSNEKIKTQLPGFRFTPLADSIQKACAGYLMSPQITDARR